jgi:hypothetical protein
MCLLGPTEFVPERVGPARRPCCSLDGDSSLKPDCYTIRFTSVTMHPRFSPRLKEPIQAVEATEDQTGKRPPLFQLTNVLCLPYAIE